MKVSVIVCSHNRIDSLLETLESLLAMDVPPSLKWEVVVVDNASQDGTAQRVRVAAARTVIPIVVLEEPRAGKPYALNRALAEARGEFILFTDDDALVDPGWLRFTLEAFATSGAHCVGGRVLPHWLGRRPPWLTDRLLNVLAMLDLGSEPRDLTTDGQALYGVNCSFRRGVFERVGPYDPRLCPQGEDQDMVDRLRAAGGRIYYDPRIVVSHKVIPERLSRSYFRQWHRVCGRDRAELLLPSRYRVLGVEGYMLRNFSLTLGRLLAATIRLDLEDAFYHELYSRLYLAYIRCRLAQFLSGRMPAPRRHVPLLAGGAEPRESPAGEDCLSRS